MNLRTLCTCLAMVAASILWMAAPTASATSLTSPEGELYTGTIKAESSNVELDGTVTVACTSSTIEGTVASHGPEAPVQVNLSGITFSGCGNDTVSVTEAGILTVNDAGTVLSTDTKVTAVLHRVILGFPITSHCIYATSGTSIGTLTGSNTTEATLDIGSSPIPQSVTDGACGEDAVLTGSYQVTTPKTLVVEKEPEFTSSAKEPTIHGKIGPTQKSEWVVDGKSATCTEATFEGKFSSPAKTIGLAPTYGLCVNFGWSGMIKPNGCTFQLLQPNLKKEGKVAINCKSGNSIVLTSSKTGEGACEVQIGTANNQELLKYQYKNIAGPPKKFEIFLELSNITGEVKVATQNCPLKQGEKKDITYKAEVLLEDKLGISDVDIG